MASSLNVGRISASNLLCKWVLQWCPSQEYGPLTSCSFPTISCSEGSAWYMAHPTLPVRAEKEGVPWVQRPQLTKDYWEVWKEETILLAIIFQQCTMWAGTSPDVFCGAVQELHECLALVVEGNWLNMEKEIWEGVMKESTLTEVQSREAIHSIFTKTSICTWTRRSGAPSTSACSTKETTTTSTQVFYPGPRGSCHATLQGCIPAWSHNLVWPLHTRITGDDHLPHPSDGQSPLLPSGSEPCQDISTEHIHLVVPGTLPKGWWTLSNYNTLLHPRKTFLIMISNRYFLSQ